MHARGNTIHDIGRQAQSRSQLWQAARGTPSWYPCFGTALVLTLLGCSQASVPEAATDAGSSAGVEIVDDSDGAVEPISFADLDCMMQPDIVFREWMLSERARELNGRRVRIGGFIRPDDRLRSIQEFILLKNTECKFGPGGEADHLIMVKLTDGVTASYTEKPLEVTGTLRIEIVTGGDGNTWAIYELAGESVEPLRRRR